MSLCAADAAQPGTDETPVRGGLLIDTNKVVGGRVELRDSVGNSSRRAKADKLAARQAHARTDVCLQFADEKLTWGDVEDYVNLQLLEAPLNIPPQATVEQINQIIANSKVRLEEIAINTFLKEAILAAEAKKAGLSVSDDELAAALAKATAKSAKKPRGAQVVPKLLDPNGYFARYQRNYLLTRKYRDEFLAPSIAISTNDIAQCIVARHEAIAEAIATNQLKKVQIGEFLSEIKAGKRDFGETAYEFSDCGSCMDNGDWGTFEAEDCNLLKPLQDFVFAPSKAEMSEVIETPYSYHIVKILKRYYGEDDEVGETPTASREGLAEGGPLVPCAVAFGIALVLSALVVFGLRGKSVSVRVLAHTFIWGGAAVAAVVFARIGEPEEVRAPTRVHVAHIMLEKEEVPAELDEAAAREVVRTKKLGMMTFKAQQEVLERAQKDGSLTCAVTMTLLNKVNQLKKMKEARK